MREFAQTEIESTVSFKAVRYALGVTDNRTLKAACEKFNIPIVVLSKTSKALRKSDYDLLLQRAMEKA